METVKLGMDERNFTAIERMSIADYTDMHK